MPLIESLVENNGRVYLVHGAIHVLNFYVKGSTEPMYDRFKETMNGYRDRIWLGTSTSVGQN